MSEEEEVVQDVLDQFSVQCQHIGGNTCFVPTDAVRRFLDVSAQQGLILAHGDVIAPEDGLSPVLAMVNDDVLAALKGLAAGSGKSVTELASACISSVLTNGDVVSKIASAVSAQDPMNGIPAPGEAVGDDPDMPSGLPGLTEPYVPASELKEPPDPWAFKMDYGTPAEQSDEFEYENLPARPLPIDTIPGLADTVAASLNIGGAALPEAMPPESHSQNPRSQSLGQVIKDLHLHANKEGSFYVALGFKDHDQIDLMIKYPDQGFDVHETYQGDFGDSIEGITERLTRWGSVAFAPKLEGGESASAKVAIEIVGFDKTKGKYEAKVGDTTIWLEPEVVDAV